MNELNANKEQSFIDHKNEDFDFKSVIKNTFDHFKNLNTCTLIFIVGLVLSNKETISSYIEPQFVEYAQSIGFLNISIAFFLVFVNSISFCRFIYDSHSKIYTYLSLVPEASHRLKNKLDRTKPLFILLILIAYFLVVVSIIFVGITLKLHK